MTTRSSVHYLGDHHCKAFHGPSGSELITDLPRDNGGQGAFFSPTDLVPTALATCLLTIMAKVAERRQLDLRGVKVEVEKTMVADPDRRIGAIRTVVHLRDGLTEPERRALERAARTCPVRRSLGDRMEVSIAFAAGSHGPWTEARPDDRVQRRKE